MISADQFEQQYEKHFDNTVWFFASKAYRNPEDIAQAGWARAWERRHQFRGDCQFHTWVIIIARNLYLMSVRKKPFESLEGLRLITPSNEDATIAKVDAERILSRLKAEDRNALKERYIEGRKSNELPGCNVTIRRRVGRATERARAMAAGA